MNEETNNSALKAGNRAIKALEDLSYGVKPIVERNAERIKRL